MRDEPPLVDALANGKFEDIQTDKRAHGSDVKRVSKAERAARKKGWEARAQDREKEVADSSRAPPSEYLPRS